MWRSVGFVGIRFSYRDPPLTITSVVSAGFWVNPNSLDK